MYQEHRARRLRRESNRIRVVCVRAKLFSVDRKKWASAQKSQIQAFNQFNYLGEVRFHQPQERYF